MLMPVDEAVQMRPHMSHLDMPVAKPAAPEVKKEAGDELSLLTVCQLPPILSLLPLLAASRAGLDSRNKD